MPPPPEPWEAGAAVAAAPVVAAGLVAPGAVVALLPPPQAATRSVAARPATIVKPAIAMDMTMSTKDATGTQTAFGYRIIGDKAFISLGPDAWMETSAADAQSTVDSFKPENFMTNFGSLDQMQAVGDETKNGVATTHYKGTAPTSVGSMFGLPTGTWTMEAWVAKDGGYLVSSALVGEATDGKFTMSVDISDLDSPNNTVEPPASFTPMAS